MQRSNTNSSHQVIAGLEAVQASLSQPGHRPFARVRQQFMGDLAALLCGLRSVLMLDYVPGTTPHTLRQLLQPLQPLVPDWTGCLLELEGCCYIAHSTRLLQQLSQLVADTSSWPAVVSFTGSEPQLMGPDTAAHQQLQQQVCQLHDAVRSSLEQSAQPLLCAGSNSTAGTAAHASSSLSSAALDAAQGPPDASTAAAPSTGKQQQASLPLVPLGSLPGLPAMPTLNGLLLGYPVVYFVRDLHEAGLASRMLSASQLKLHRVVATPSAQLAETLAAAAGESASRPVGQTGANIVLMGFTVPKAVGATQAEQRVELVLRRLQAQAVLSEVWQGVDLSTMLVGPQAVSL